jgi:hypothetical protein
MWVNLELHVLMCFCSQGYFEVKIQFWKSTTNTYFGDIESFPGYQLPSWLPSVSGSSSTTSFHILHIHHSWLPFQLIQHHITSATDTAFLTLAMFYMMYFALGIFPCISFLTYFKHLPASPYHLQYIPPPEIHLHFSYFSSSEWSRWQKWLFCCNGPI